LNPDDLLNPDFIIQLANQLKVERAEKQRLQITAELQQKELKAAAPKVEYCETVLQSESLIATTIVAKDLGMSAVTLNAMLHKKGIIHKIDGVWVLYSQFQNKGYTKTKTHTYFDYHNNVCTQVLTYWTEKGRQFVNQMMKKDAELQLT